MADNAVESSSPYMDFDAATSNNAPLRVKISGREYELPSDPPAGPFLMGLKQGEAIMDDGAEMVRFLELLIGPERLAQMTADGIGVRQLNELSRWLTKQYGFEETEGDSVAPLVSPPGKRPTRSSKNGRSSKRTSGTTTASVTPIS